MKELTPHEIVTQLDKYIVGQDKAKRSVAVALRNRYRRRQLPEDMQEEIKPRNILMVGPTGVGKTEIARRLAKLVNAPFIKVEATKFTEVGYVGRDVDSMIRDLLETSIRMVKNIRLEEVRSKAEAAADERIVEILVPSPKKEGPYKNPFEVLFGSSGEQQPKEGEREETKALEEERRIIRSKLRIGELEGQMIEVEIEDRGGTPVEFFTGMGTEEMSINFRDLLGGMIPGKKKKKRVTVREARKILAQDEASSLLDMDQITTEAVAKAEQNGIIFLDEIDKIASGDYKAGPDVSREGVQRDILPLVEGSTVMTKYGPVKTDHILFIAAGAFHIAKPSDLIPEFQGRFPIRVELDSLSVDDFKRILIQPKNALMTQYTALLGTEGIKIDIREDAVERIAEISYAVNQADENIGARRLHQIVEKLFEEVSFSGSDLKEKNIAIDGSYVTAQLKELITEKDINRFII
ncbi:MAG: ATP-dependent protease ATPase subunit HslU [Bacillota bacterium]|nr:ATP-dependent protease ATPase subunit HslU [Bacillota bacterium]MDD3297470.1 ATP-dependent protease ATPase subunit HslU [Bacillota bacterium]MDD3850143.1 ATP-dependent protease ATPase subunit HslU [Bacillota bacterium]MDD4706866.1 ATP-dependent protease ATPase subunit HslU [Bacillota bacterium]